ncbi:hypothetical protein SAMN02746041_01805 [Desulfacinum hydrothermale DSM 13146]|uniref:Uncharacterized protein n=1 Tax=Desulfacinum hydrothermale DSM 13146 TaxID=1121390 RepID=A0A1W1XI95_9BACT|nr:hypothetical protein [Desulfacinum hydrothermale]SMC23689.1 hypothetical protein SAMN02746041_01805 [Desulfacinum hydrothermale DSM 13146]
MTNQAEIPKITSANTKKEMLEAYNKLRKLLAERSKETLKPKEEKEKREKREVVTTADALPTERVLETINQLKMETAAALNAMSARLEEETTRYAKIKKAIEIKEKELEEIFGIEREAHSLAALLEAQREKKAQFEQDMAARKEALEEEIRTKRAEWEKQKQAMAEQIKELKREEEKKRVREREEYEYNLKREREQKVNALQDELARLQKEIDEKKAAFEKETAEVRQALEEREAKVAEREKRVEELEAKVAAFPQELEKEVKKAVREATERVQAEAAAREALMKKSFEGEKNVLLAKIASLESLVETQRSQIEKLTLQVEAAYGKVQDIAVRAVGAAGRAPSGTPAAVTVSKEEDL